ncbi:MAG: hypothetical protein FP815_08280 [Desulfobulbaceae bacterium]|nr:hypothetical protein [Desulfobulbaceae bacterium]
MPTWFGRTLMALAILALLILALPSALRFTLFRQGLPFGLKERFNLSANVRLLDWRHLDLNQVTWGEQGNETLETKAITVSFSPTGLLARTLDDVTISGLTIHLTNNPNGFRLREVPEKDQKTLTPPTTTETKGFHLPLAFRNLDIDYGRILVHTPDTTIDIPFRLHLETNKDHPDRLLFSTELLAGSPMPTIKGEINLAALTVQAEYTCPLAALSRFLPELAGVPEVIVSGRLNVTLDPEGQWALSTNATLNGKGNKGTITASLPARETTLSPIHFQAQGKGTGPAGAITLSGTLDTLNAGPATLRQLSVNLPWSWPNPPDSGEIGKLGIEAITIHNQKIGTLGLSVRQTGLAAGKITGSFQGEKDFPLKVELKGTAGLDQKNKGSQFDFSLTLPPLDLKNTNWPEFINLFQPKSMNRSAINLAGILTAKITARGDTFHQEVKGEVNITDGALSLSQKKITVSGISGAVSFPNVLLRSNVPQAAFSFEKATIGDLRLTDGELDLHRDGEESLFVERVKTGWSGGTIHALGLRLQAGSRDLAGDLFCDRLNLAQLLTQLGIPQVSGKGTISGHLPMKYINGKIQVAQGFLYSPPGDGGSIRFAASDLITGGVPAGTPQFHQLQFASAALEDFSYNWLSLSLESKGEEMVIAMSLDGHPAKPLPFRYDSRLGTFTKVTSIGEIGINQPIRLDVNFRLPFNEFLCYGKSIQTLRDQLR